MEQHDSHVLAQFAQENILRYGARNSHSQEIKMLKTTSYNFTAKTAELQLADVVELFEGPFGTGIVKQIADGFVTMFRPYGTSTDVAYSNGVICYTGIEEYKFSLTDKQEFFVYQRKLNLA